MVAVRVARIVLHVANENVLPIDDIERAVGCKFKIDGPKVKVLGDKKILAKLRGEAGAVLDDLMLLGTEKTNGVIVEDITLHLFRKMATAHEL